MATIASASSGQAAADGAARLRSDGFLAIPGVLRPAAVARLAAALDRVYEEEVARGRTRAGAPMHLLGEIGRDDLFLELVDHPVVFPVICGELGWNIHLYHCHLDVTPPRAEPRRRYVWGWHQDGGRQNVDLDSDPRPRMSLKVAFWLSDLSEPGRGNMLVVPGSHESTSTRPASAFAASRACAGSCSASPRAATTSGASGRTRSHCTRSSSDSAASERAVSSSPGR
jgi:ectoine hydroxylase